MAPAELIKPETKDAVARKFIGYVRSVCERLNLPEDNVSISAIELSAALNEIKKDLAIMQHRRKPEKGTSWSKIAGVVWFRLIRYRIVNIHSLDDLDEERKFYRAQDIAVFEFVFERILRISPHEQLMRELLYVSSRRHINQEMLGVTFGVLLSMQEEHG